MKDLNYDRLREALNRLPSYRPPASTWSAIEAGMQKETEEEVESVSGKLELPQYSPPSSVWNAINQNLDGRAFQRRRLKVVAGWAARAAAVLVLFGAGYFSATRDSGPTLVITEKVETAPIRPTFVSFPEDDQQFDNLLIELEDLNRPSLNGMRLELEELNSAKQEIEAMLVSYGHDPAIMNQLADIERERSNVYRRIRSGM